MPTTAVPGRTGSTATHPPRAGAPVDVPRTHRLPTATRERRPALVAAGVVLVVAGALGSVLVVHRTGDRVDVLVARQDIAPGELVTAADLGVVRVAADGAAVVPASALANFVGTYATTRVPARTLLNRTMFVAGDTVPADAAVVGLVLGPEQRPSRPLVAGDVVRAFLVSADGSSTVSGRPAGTTLVDAARVVAGGEPTGGEGAGGDVTATGGDAVSLLLPVGTAADVVAAAAAGQVALVRLADATTPTVDLLGG